MSDAVVIIGGTFAQADAHCHESGWMRANRGHPDSPIWTNDPRRLRGLRIRHLVVLDGADPELVALARSMVKS